MAAAARSAAPAARGVTATAAVSTTPATGAVIAAAGSAATGWNVTPDAGKFDTDECDEFNVGDDEDLEDVGDDEDVGVMRM